MFYFCLIPTHAVLFPLTLLSGFGYKSDALILQACFFTDFTAIQDNGISLILSLEKNFLSLGENSLSLGGKSLSFRKST